MKKILASGLLFGLLLSAAAISDQPVTGMAAFSNLDQLWQYNGKVKTAMSSSTDPKGSNKDFMYFHGRYKGGNILAKIDGPGCVYRIWSARASGTIKVYLDGSGKPEISCPFKDYLKGRCPGLASEFSVGRTANYMPICFEKSVIITAPGFEIPAYYQVSYQTYDSSVKVSTFKKSAALSGPDYQAAKAAWANPGPQMPAGIERAESTGKPGELSLVIKGAGVIRKLAIKNIDNPSDPLAGYQLKIFWDDSDQAAVDVPLNAFFLNQFDLKDKWPAGSLKNFFVSAGKDGYSATFPMPFATGAKIIVSGPGGKNIQIAAFREKRDSLPMNAMRFHALYKSKEFPENEKRENIISFLTPVSPDHNWVALDESGRGNYLGCALFVKSVGTVWWGEGDEMDWIDGSASPQIQGTGTEDEFNWSWGYNPHMSAVSGTLPVIPPCDETIVAQVVPQLRNKECQKIRGENIAYRFRPSDYVPFEKSIKVSYEILGNSFLAPHLLGNMSQQRGDDYASVAYWYEMQ